MSNPGEPTAEKVEGALRRTKKPPHVILLICDQMQQQRLGTQDPNAYTPHLDQMAEEGVSFRRAYCSNAQCSPSRASLQTGQYPHEAGVMVIYGFGGHTGHLGPRHTTIAQIFKESGYRTALFGKSHFGSPLSTLGYQYGDERGCGTSLAQVDREITDDAIAFLNELEDDRPIFLVVSWHQPHPPFEQVEPFYSQVIDRDLPLPESFSADDLSDKPTFHRERRESQEGGYRHEGELREELARYYSMISAVDHEVGRLVNALRTRGMWDNSVVAFTSDHGDMMGAHGLRLKGPLPYEELFRVPLILRGPTIQGGRVSDALTVNVELPGTLMDLAGVPRPASWPERPAIPSLVKDEPGAEHVFMEHYGANWGWHPFKMIITQSHKYVRYYGPDDGAEELYDVENDPHELTNLAGDLRYADLQETLRERLESWWSDTGGRDWQYYESDEFRLRDAETLVQDSHLWAST